MSDREFSDATSLILTGLNRLDRILRIKEIEPLGDITTGGKAPAEHGPVEDIASVPLKNFESPVSASEAPVMPTEEYVRRFDSMRLRAIENRQRDLESGWNNCRK